MASCGATVRRLCFMLFQTTILNQSQSLSIRYTFSNPFDKIKTNVTDLSFLVIMMTMLEQTKFSPRRGIFEEPAAIPEYRFQGVRPDRDDIARPSGQTIGGVCHSLRFQDSGSPGSWFR